MSYPAASKVVVDGEVIQDLTEDTVTPETLLRGVTAHNAVGNAITGSFDAEAYESALAIVVDGDEAPQNITAGQYLFIKNHSTLATGGYHATTAIASGDSIASSNVAADPDGFANSIKDKIGNVGNTDLQSQITLLNSKITTFAVFATTGNSTSMEIQLPENAIFTSLCPLFLISSYRSSASNENEGFAVIKINDGVPYVTNKSGIRTLSNLVYNGSTKKLTLTTGTYLTFMVFGVAS